MGIWFLVLSLRRHLLWCDVIPCVGFGFSATFVERRRVMMTVVLVWQRTFLSRIYVNGHLQDPIEGPSQASLALKHVAEAPNTGLYLQSGRLVLQKIKQEWGLRSADITTKLLAVTTDRTKVAIPRRIPRAATEWCLKIPVSTSTVVCSMHLPTKWYVTLRRQPIRRLLDKVHK